MIHVSPLQQIQRCEGDHSQVTDWPQAILCIEGVEDAFILVCRVCAEQLIMDIQAQLSRY